MKKALVKKFPRKRMITPHPLDNTTMLRAASALALPRAAMNTAESLYMAGTSLSANGQSNIPLHDELA